MANAKKADLFRLFFIATVILLFLWDFMRPDGSIEAGQDPEPTLEMSAEAGFDSYYKSSFWVPVDISMSNDGATIEGDVQISVGSNAGRDQVIYSTPVSLPTRSNKRLTTFVYLPNLIGRLEVTLVDGRGNPIIAVQSNNLNRLETDDLLYGVLSPEPGDIEFLEDVTGGRGNAAVAFLDIDGLPDVAAAWNALDVLVIHDVDTSELRPEQYDGLRNWISTGGQLVVTGGPGWRNASAGVIELLPVEPSEIVTRDDLPGLSARSSQPFRDPGPYLVTRSTLRQGELLLHEDGMPILARQGYGRGSVYFLALDPSLAPLVDWDGSPQVWSEVAAAAPRLPVWAIGAQNSYSAGTAVSSLPSLSLPSTVQLIIFLAVYVLFVGPANFLVLRRLRRRELAWITIPAIVLIFTFIGLVAGFQLKGNDTILNQMSIAFGHIDGDGLRVQSLVGLYSPRRATYDISLPAEAMVRPFRRDTGVLAGSMSTGAVVRNGSVEVREVRVDVSAVETMVADSYTRPPLLDGQATVFLDESGVEVEVTVQNNDRFELENATILIGSTAVALGNISPGGVVTVRERIGLSSAAAFGAGGGGVILGTPRGGAGPSPLSTNYSTILGASDYFSDRQVYPRWQLLQSIAPEFGATSGTFPQGIATLVAWSQQDQLDLSLGDDAFTNQSTTLYFLELPLNQNILSGEDVVIPETFLEWEILATNGVFEPGISDFYMPPGWVEYEYRPWPEFRNMDVGKLEISLLNSNSSVSQPSPQVQLWDWNREAWASLAGLGWGINQVPDPAPFIGAGNTVRLRLQNDNSTGIDIGKIFPRLIGDL